MSTWMQSEAEKAFGRAARAHRRARLMRRLQRVCTECGLLPVADDDTLRAGRAARGRREIPVDAITATTEPNRAAQFDSEFRPAAHTRARWQRVWMAMHQGVTLPPISVIRVGDEYAIRDGHHRVSVARARGVVSISAVVA
jgi:hypothetical protein